MRKKNCGEYNVSINLYDRTDRNNKMSRIATFIFYDEESMKYISGSSRILPSIGMNRIYFVPDADYGCKVTYPGNRAKIQDNKPNKDLERFEGFYNIEWDPVSKYSYVDIDHKIAVPDHSWENKAPKTHSPKRGKCEHSKRRVTVTTMDDWIADIDDPTVVKLNIATYEERSSLISVLGNNGYKVWYDPLTEQVCFECIINE